MREALKQAAAAERAGSYRGIGRPAAELLAGYHRRKLAEAEAEVARHA